MRERPILFSGAMVEAILAGRKTQTRRLVRPMDVPCLGKPDPERRYAEPGDRLWVRETWSHATGNGLRVVYRADLGTERWPPNVDDPGDRRVWRPSIFMRRPDSRITLEVTSVRVERLHQISEEDARAEGMDPSWEHRCHGGWPGAIHRYTERGGREVLCPICGGSGFKSPAYREAFEAGWDSINEKRAPWASNPWVWVVGFRRVEAA
jgi:hypothetical protein